MYLDPGFGGMLLQVVVGIAAVGGIILFSLRRKLRNLFSKKKAAGENQAENSLHSKADALTDSDDVIDMLSDSTADDNEDTNG